MGEEEDHSEFQKNFGCKLIGPVVALVSEIIVGKEVSALVCDQCYSFLQHLLPYIFFH